MTAHAQHKGTSSKMVPWQPYIHLYESVCVAQRCGFRAGRALEQPAHLTLTSPNTSPPHPSNHTQGSDQAHFPGTHPPLIPCVISLTCYPILKISLPILNVKWRGEGEGMGTDTDTLPQAQGPRLGRWWAGKSEVHVCTQPGTRVPGQSQGQVTAY